METVLLKKWQQLFKNFNKHYTCYRFGGDEFSIMAMKQIKKIENRLRIMTKSYEMREKGKSLPTISYGYSIFRGGEKLDFDKPLKAR